MAAGRRALQQLGVSVEIGQPDDPDYSYGSRAPSAQELESRGAKFTIMDILNAYNHIPREYVALSGLKHIVIVAGTGQDVGGYADVTGKHDRFYEDIGAAGNGEIAAHENYHLLDAAFCKSDGMFQDPDFSAFNGRQDIYSSNPNDTHHESYDSFIYADGKLVNAAFLALDAHHYKRYCAMLSQEKTLAATVLTASNYHTDVAEDKAEIGKNTVNLVNYSETTDSQFPVLKAKFRYLFARLYQHAPNVARYFAAVTDRPDKPYVAPKAHC